MSTFWYWTMITSVFVFFVALILWGEWQAEQNRKHRAETMRRYRRDMARQRQKYRPK